MKADRAVRARASYAAAALTGALALSGAAAGCVGYARDDGGEEAVIVTEPVFFLWSGYESGGYYRDYGRRGFESRRGMR